MEIREFIDQLCSARALSLTELASVLQYRSKTSLSRMLRGESDVRALESFTRRAREYLKMTAEEHAQLKQIIRKARMGNWDGVREMEAFMQMETPTEAPIRLEDLQGHTVDLRQHLASRACSRIHLLNCQHVPVFTALSRVAREHDTRIVHFLLDRDHTADAIHAMRVVLPLVYDEHYEGFMLHPAPEGQVMGFCGADGMLLSYPDASGAHTEELIVFDAADHGLILTAQQGDRLSRTLDAFRSWGTPIKQPCFSCDMMEDYIQYSRDYAELERDCAQYIIKPDLCIDMIPTPVLRAAFVDKCGDASAQLVDALVPIYNDRFTNQFTKRKPTHCLLKRRAMWSFARTGQTQDHFWGMRPYTPTERVEIFRNLIQQMSTNPYFNLYILLDDDSLKDIQIGYYEGKGLLFLSAHTAFNLAEGHSQILITQREFLELYKTYYLEYLLKESVCSGKKTLELLNEMLIYCKSLT